MMATGPETENAMEVSEGASQQPSGAPKVQLMSKDTVHKICSGQVGIRDRVFRRLFSRGFFFFIQSSVSR
jgi:hypothetical protein